MNNFKKRIVDFMLWKEANLFNSWLVSGFQE